MLTTTKHLLAWIAPLLFSLLFHPVCNPIHLTLPPVIPPKAHPKSHGREPHRRRQTPIKYQNLRIAIRRRQRQSQQTAARSRQAEKGLHGTLHAFRRLGKGVFVRGRIREDFAGAFEDEDGDLVEHGDLVRYAAVVGGWALQRVRVAGRSGVDEMLEYGGVDHGKGFEDEPYCHAADGWEWDAEAVEGRV